MSDEYDYVCDGKTCCLIPKYKLPPKTTKECENNMVCFNEIPIEEKDDFCKECLDLPFENKKLFVVEQEENCTICSKECTRSVKRNLCDHIICINCFRKVYFKKSFSKPVFPYLTDNVDETDSLVLKYKKELEYWNKFQKIEHEKDSECNICSLKK